MERNFGDDRKLVEGRRLYNRFNVKLGQARAIVHMGGTPVFAPEDAQTVSTAPAIEARSTDDDGAPW